MATYAPGHLKHDPATGTVAVRTKFPDEEPFTEQAWMVFTSEPRVAARPTTYVDGLGLPDAYTPPEPEPEPEPEL